MNSRFDIVQAVPSRRLGVMTYMRWMKVIDRMCVMALRPDGVAQMPSLHERTIVGAVVESQYAYFFSH